jgi:hypothetical protein
MTKESNTPYALVYKNGDVYSIYTTFDDTQIIFYWNEQDQSQHKHPIVRSTKKVLDQCYIKVLSRFGCQIMLWGELVEFEFDHSRSLKDEKIVWHGPIIDVKNEWTDHPDFYRDSPTSDGVYDGSYNTNYSEAQEYDDNWDDYEGEEVAYKMTMGIQLD